MKNGLKRFLSILTAMLFLLPALCGAMAEGNLLPGAEGFRYEGEGFDTPEEAALQYLAGLKNLDMEQMLSAYAWETQAEHYDLRSQIARAGGIDPSYVSVMPSSPGLQMSSNLEMLRVQQVNLIYRALENYINGELYNSPTGALRLKEEAEIEAYFSHWENGRLENLAEMTNIRFYTSDDVTGGRFSMEKIQQNYLRTNAQYGADETRDVVIVADIGEESVAVAPTVARYGDRWYLVTCSSFTSMYLGIAPNTQAFTVLPENLKGALQSLTPAAVVSALPENKASGIRYEGEGFAQPEEAVACYLEGLKNGNLQQMLSAFAWETQNDRYSLKDNILRMGAVFQDMPIRIPAFHAMISDANLRSLRYTQTRRIYNAVWENLLAEADQCRELLDGYRVTLDSDEKIDGYLGLYENDREEKLATMKNFRMVLPVFLVPGYRVAVAEKQLEANRKVYGADQLLDVFGIVDLDQELLICNPLLARYGDRWYLVSASGIAFNVLGIDSRKQAFFTVNGTYESLLQALNR